MAKLLSETVDETGLRIRHYDASDFDWLDGKQEFYAACYVDGNQLDTGIGSTPDEAISAYMAKVEWKVAA